MSEPNEPNDRLEPAASDRPDSGRGGRASARAYLALRHRDFRLLCVAEGISSAGSQIQRVAVAWQIYRLTESPVALGVLGLCRFVPVIVFGIAGGVIADRRDRRRLLLWSEALLLLTSAALALLTWSGSIALVAIYALTVVAATLESVANPTRAALIPVLVPRRDMPGATTMNLLVFHLAAVGGPALGGAIIALLGVGAAYAIDAASFVAVIAAVLMMRARPTLPPITTSGFAAAMEGLRYLRGTPVLLGVMVTDFFATLFGASMVLMPIFAQKILGAGPGGLGLLLAAPAAGAVIVAAVMSVARLPTRAGMAVLVAVALYGACLVGFGLSTRLWLSLLFLFGSGAADSVSMTLRHALRNLLSPDALRARIAAVHRTLGAGGPQLGEFEAGVAAALIGAGPAVALGGLGTIVVAAVVARRTPAIPAYHLGSDLVATSSDPEPVVSSPLGGAVQQSTQ